MEPTGLLKQANEPLFPKILWNRPVNKRAAGRLSLIGGHANQFSGLQNAYLAAQAAGIGAAKVILPKSVYKHTGALPDCVFLEATESGSLSKSNAGFIKAAIADSDSGLLGIELSLNAETTSLVEGLLPQINQPVLVVEDALLVMLHAAHTLENRPNLVIAAPMAYLLKLTNAIELPMYVQEKEGLLRKAEFVYRLHRALQTPLVLLGPDIIIAVADKLSTTPWPDYSIEKHALGYGVLSTFMAQHPETLFETLTTAAHVISQSRDIASLKALLDSL